MSLKIQRGFVALIAVVFATVLGVTTVNAQEGNNRVANGFRVSPVRSELSIEKGKSQTITVTVENPTDVTTTAQAVVNDFVASEDESGTPRLILDDSTPAPKNSFKKLVGPVTDIPLAPKEKKDVSVKISVPADANSGGYYGAIRFIPTTGSQQSNVGLTASVGTIALVTVPGNLSEKANLLQISAGQNDNAKSFIMNGDVQLISRIKNDGDIHVKPFGRVEVKNMFGKSIGQFEFNNTEPRANILPGSTRKFVDKLPSSKMVGRYTITANLGYSQGSGDLITAKATYWYVPAWALAVLVALLAGIGVGIYMLVRKLGGGHNHRAKK